MRFQTDYASLYAIYRKLRWIRDPFGVFLRWHLERKFQPMMMAELEDEHRRVFPRRRKIVVKNLPEETIAAFREKWCERATEYAKCAIGRERYLSGKLFRMAQEAELIPLPEMRVVHGASSHSYGSQGYGASKYARGEAEGYLNLIVAEGFDAEIREVNGHTDKKWGIYYADYEVWAPLEDWQVDVILRRSKTSLMDWAVACWKSGCNPKVLDPFLDDEVFDKSCDIAMGVRR